MHAVLFLCVRSTAGAGLSLNELNGSPRLSVARTGEGPTRSWVPTYLRGCAAIVKMGSKLGWTLVFFGFHGCNTRRFFFVSVAFHISVYTSCTVALSIYSPCVLRTSAPRYRRQSSLFVALAHGRLTGGLCILPILPVPPVFLYLAAAMGINKPVSRKTLFISVMSQSALPLDASIYALTEDEAAFFKVETGIQDDVQLKNHILAIQEEAYKVRVDIFTRSSIF